MSDTAASPPAGTPPVDRRPRPQYGELAPEGWVWTPPADAPPATGDATAPAGEAGTAARSGADVSAPNSTAKAAKVAKPAKVAKVAKPSPDARPPKNARSSMDAAQKPTQSSSRAATTAADSPAAGSTPARAVPAWDRYLTITLLFVGLLATFSAVSTFSGVPTVMQQLYTVQDLGTYEAAASVSGTLLTGSIAEGLIWAATAALSVSLMVRGKRTFYLPIIGGIISGVVLFAVMAVVVVTDPTLLTFYGQP
jgi:hypothetical protein